MNNETPDENSSAPLAEQQPDTSAKDTQRTPTPPVRYNVQELVDMLRETAKKAKDPRDKIKAIELILEFKNSGRKYARDRKPVETPQEPEPSNQSMTDEQKGVLGF